jgi:cobalamin biosynthesis protein CobD/CbiB
LDSWWRVNSTGTGSLGAVGKAEEARRWLGKAQAWLDQYGDWMPARAEAEVGLHLHNWLEAHVLRREAEALIQPAEKR